MRSGKPFLYLLWLGILFLSGCQSPRNGPLFPITIGSAPLESSALIYIAERQGLFASNGLQVVVRDYDTGAAALSALVNGEVELAVPAEDALVGRAFNQDKIRALASIDKAEYFDLVARRDQGITTVVDLKGKKVGVVRNTIAEFYLGRFLELHGLTAGQVTLVDVNIAQSEAAIAGGQVDAILTRPPYLAPIEESLAQNEIVWEAQNSQPLYAVLIGRNDWIAEHPQPLLQLFRALIQAERYLMQYPAPAQGIVQTRLNLDGGYMTAVWTHNQFSVSLDQSLILAMEDEARWMISNHLTTAKQVPDFLGYIDETVLQYVKPDAVNIIR